LLFLRNKTNLHESELLVLVAKTNMPKTATCQSAVQSDALSASEIPSLASWALTLENNQPQNPFAGHVLHKQT